MGYPEWRSRVLYVPQKSPALPGTPDEFVHSVGRYFVQKRRLMTTDYVCAKAGKMRRGMKSNH